MKKERKRTICFVLARFFLVGGVLLTAYAIYVLATNKGHCETYFCLASVSAVIGGLFNNWQQSIEEQDNPLNFERVSTAVKYATTLQEGTTQEFVEKFGLQMYKHLQKKGIIHQLQDFRIKEEKWEVTEYGKRFK